MGQLNINLTPEFERELTEYMKRAKITQKSEAVRKAVHEATEKLKAERRETDFSLWLGLALKAPLNPHPRFKTHDDLWEKDKED